jgi:hypothetical protein
VRLLCSNYRALKTPKRKESTNRVKKIKECETGEYLARMGRKDMRAGI